MPPRTQREHREATVHMVDRDPPLPPEADLLSYAELIEDADDLIYAVDMEGRFTYVNRGAEHIIGYTPAEMLTMSIADLIPPGAPLDYSASHLTLKLDGRADITRYQTPVRTKSGATIIVDVRSRLVRRNGVPVGIQGIARDVTESKRMEERLRDAQRFESLAILAGGVAHDFNNLLMSIVGNASLASALLEENSPARESLDAIERTALQARDLTGHLLAYSGGGRFAVQLLRLDAVVEELRPVLRSAAGDRIEVTHLDDGNSPDIEADGAQMRQVVLNLFANAVDAIADARGRVVVRTGRLEGDAAALAEVFPDARLAGGTYALLSVADDGLGMDGATVRRIFDPFFSTRGAGRGLGLASVLGIVRGHRGAIKVDSAPGSGTTVTAAIPARLEGGSG